MRHRVKGHQLNRDVQHRRALYKNLITSLIVNGHIKTTEAKAKAIKGQVDKLMSKAKKGSLHHRRSIDAYLNRRSVVNKLVDEIAPQTGKRKSGFTRIIRLGARPGDNSMMVKLEFVDSIGPKQLDTSKKSQKPKAKAKSKPTDQKTKAVKTTTAPVKTTKPAQTTTTQTGSSDTAVRRSSK